MFDHIAKEKLEAIIEECDKDAQWLNESEARQNLKQKWEPFELSNAVLTTRNTELVKNSTKTLCEPRPKVQPKQDKKEDAGSEEGAEVAEVAEEKPVSRWRKFRRVFFIGGGIVAILAVAAVGATYFGLVESGALMPGALLRQILPAGGEEVGDDIEEPLVVEDSLPEAEEL